MRTKQAPSLGGLFRTKTSRMIGIYLDNSPFIIQDLFLDGEDGFYYDPYELDTTFQEYFGRNSITASGQDVGLLLDEKDGLSLSDTTILDQEFNGSPAWYNTDAWTVKDGKASAVGVSKGLYQGNKIVAGRLYRATITVDLISGSLRLPYDGYSSNSVQVNTSGTYTRYFFGTLTNFYAAFGINFTGSVSNLSIVEVNGHHAHQSDIALQPTIQLAPNKIVYDAVNDKLITKLPTQLTGCTVVRAIPNVGTQILTNQTIPTTYEDSTTYSALLVINRELTIDEVSKVTAVFNTKAGI